MHLPIGIWKVTVEFPETNEPAAASRTYNENATIILLEFITPVERTAKHYSTITNEAIIQESRQISLGWTEISSERSH